MKSYVTLTGSSIFLILVGIVIGLFLERIPPAMSIPMISTQTPAERPTMTAQQRDHLSNVNGVRMPADELDNCQSAVPIVDMLGHPSGAIKSSAHVYNYSCDLFAGANPNTFTALSYFYGKDEHGVWILASPWDEWSYKAQIKGADPETFTLIPDARVSGTSYYEGFSTNYTKDKNNVYFLGDIVHFADPETFTLDDPPAVASCMFDAHDAHLKFYQGQMIPPAGVP